MEQVVERLNLDESYYARLFLRFVNIYKGFPIDVNFLNEVGLSKRLGMEAQIESDEKFVFRFPNVDKEWQRASFGVRVTSNSGVFTVEKNTVV